MGARVPVVDRWAILLFSFGPSLCFFFGLLQKEKGILCLHFSDWSICLGWNASPRLKHGERLM